MPKTLEDAARELLEAVDGIMYGTSPYKDWASLSAAKNAVRAALATADGTVRVTSEWQPIDTAPKDGTWVLLATPKGRIADGCFGNYGAWVWPYVMVEPTHWIPMLTRPTLAVAQEPTDDR